MTIATEGNVTEDFGGLDGAAAFLSHLIPDSKKEEGEDAHREPSEKDGENQHTEQGTQDHEDDEGSHEETPSDPEETSDTEETEEPEKKYVDSDDVFVKIKVGDQELEVPVKDLKRLHGQEAALTRKGQEIAEQRKLIDQQKQQYAAGLDALMKRASARADEYRKVNFLALTKDPNVTPDMLNALQDEARKAFEEETYIKTELNNFVQKHQQETQAKLVETARNTIKVLGAEKDGEGNPNPLHIPGWNQKLYDDLRRFAVEQGVDQNVVNNLVDAPALKIIHMAMMYKKGSSKVATKIVNKSPKKIIKQSTRPVPPKAKNVEQRKAAMKDLERRGNTDAAANAFLSRWASDGTE